MNEEFVNVYQVGGAYTFGRGHKSRQEADAAAVFASDRIDMRRVYRLRVRLRPKFEDMQGTR